MHRFVTKNTDLAITRKKERHVFFTKSYKIILINAYKWNKVLQCFSVQEKLNNFGE